MKILSAEFEVSAARLAQAPRLPLPEFAFIGRSNVGKSSLINALTERRQLAKVSDMPGKTQLINFFVINRKWRLVDLPGYGYAKVKKEKRADFNEATAEFLQGRERLECIFVLIDSRIEPQEIDLSFIDWLVDAELPFAVVFTKADKQSAGKTEAAVQAFKQAAFADLQAEPRCFVTSSESRAGCRELLGFIDECLKS